MQQRRWHRATSSLVGALALTATVGITATPAAATPHKAEPLSVFPSDSLTVHDPAQITGRRVNLPLEGCGQPIACGLVAELNELDGFDLDPRIAVRFSGPVDPAQVAARITVQEARGGWRTGVDRVVWDPATNTLYAHPAEQLRPSTTYKLRVQGGPANKAVHDTFTTLSATDGLLDIREQIDTGAAFGSTGITPGLRVEGVFPVAGTTVAYRADNANPPTPPATNPAPVPTQQLPPDSTLVFGSYLAPSWLQSDVTIAQTPTGDDGPAPVGAVRLPFVAVLPPGPAPEGGWPTAIYGHGFTQSTTNVFLAATTNARAGLATIGTNVVGHGFGPDSTYVVTRDGVTTELGAYGRGVDQADADTTIGSTEGSSATGAASAQSSRDALRQTAADVMTLARSLGATTADSVGTAAFSGEDVTYFGQSFGGIYGTLVTGADDDITRSVLNVPGSPITEIARLSPSFRLLTTQSLQAAGLLNRPDLAPFYFQEQLPLRGEGPVTLTVPGAAAVQEFLARTTWLSRPGSPETFSPLIEPERVLVQVAHGDRTVPNPTSYTLVDAGDLWSRTSLYRNDLTSQAGLNPHSFLLDLRPETPQGGFRTAALQGQSQVTAFLGAGQVVDPDGPAPVWEVPIVDPARLLPLNYPFPAIDDQF